MSTHNICFCWEIRKISAFFRWKKHLICCYDHLGLLSPFIFSVVLNDSVNGQWRPWSDCASVQSAQGLHCPHMTWRHICAWWSSFRTAALFPFTGQEPIITKDLDIICEYCNDKERFNPVENTPSNEFSECPRKKTKCIKGITCENTEPFAAYIQNRLCRCDYQNDFIPEFYDFDHDRWTCGNPDDLYCVKVPCPESVDGRKQRREQGNITKTCPFKYTENFTTKKWKFSDKKFWYFSYFCSQHRLRWF